VTATIVLLTERRAGRRRRPNGWSPYTSDEGARYHVLVPADPHRNMLADVLDHLSLLELRGALDAARGPRRRREPRRWPPRSWTPPSPCCALPVREAGGEVTQDEPLPALEKGVREYSADEVVVVTRPHAVEDTFLTGLGVPGPGAPGACRCSTCTRAGLARLTLPAVARR
jgi:hypothetical protein